MPWTHWMERSGFNVYIYRHYVYNANHSFLIIRPCFVKYFVLIGSGGGWLSYWGDSSQAGWQRQLRPLHERDRRTGRITVADRLHSLHSGTGTIPAVLVSMCSGRQEDTFNTDTENWRRHCASNRTISVVSNTSSTVNRSESCSDSSWGNQKKKKQSFFNRASVKHPFSASRCTTPLRHFLARLSFMPLRPTLPYQGSSASHLPKRTLEVGVWSGLRLLEVRTNTPHKPKTSPTTCQNGWMFKRPKQQGPRFTNKSFSYTWTPCWMEASRNIRKGSLVDPSSKQQLSNYSVGTESGPNSWMTFFSQLYKPVTTSNNMDIWNHF